jgi:hypothetical protein
MHNDLYDLNNLFTGGKRMQDSTRKWHDQRVSQLYNMAMIARYETVRREVLKVLGVLERVGCDEAACAIDDIKRQTENKSSRHE